MRYNAHPSFFLCISVFNGDSAPMADGSKSINVEVAYALPDKQKIIALTVTQDCCAYDAVLQSRIAEHFDGLDVEQAAMGIFGKAIKPKDYQLAEGDRVEIYRPLQADPKAARKERAAKAKAAKASATS